MTFATQKYFADTFANIPHTYREYLHFVFFFISRILALRISRDLTEKFSQIINGEKKTLFVFS